MSEQQNSGPRHINHDTPQPSAPSDRRWGSDAIADTLRALDLPYLALNPGASYRGLHDSLVNHLGNEAPQMLLCLHEESAVSIAQGYAKAGDRMMGAVLHSNVGLMHAALAQGLQAVQRGVVLVDVRLPTGYDSNLSGAPAASQQR